MEFEFLFDFHSIHGASNDCDSKVQGIHAKYTVLSGKDKLFGINHSMKAYCFVMLLSFNLLEEASTAILKVRRNLVLGNLFVTQNP